MSQPAPSSTSNQLLSALTPADWDSVVPHLTRVPTVLRQPFERAHKPIEFIYFPESGLASIVAQLPNGHSNEVGLFGRDGMTGSCLISGDTQSPFDCFVQMEGEALRMPADALAATMSASATLRLAMMQFTRALTIQTAYTALSNGQSHVDQRVARWLLMVHDRVDGDVFSITHEYLSIMLGVRRTGVTDAMHVLEGKHLIVSTRNRVVIKDRSGLIALSSGAYGPSEAEYTRITGISLAKAEMMATA
jgi:CRP-like cAMP-binding protein